MAPASQDAAATKGIRACPSSTELNANGRVESLHATERGAGLAGRRSMAWLPASVVKALVAIEPARVGFDSRQVAGHSVDASIDRIEPVIGALLAVLTGTE
jgi:hypothetical protein